MTSKIDLIIHWFGSSDAFGVESFIDLTGLCTEATVKNLVESLCSIEIRQRVKTPSLSGLVSVSDWASAVESVMYLGLPWRMLRSQLVTSKTVDGMIDYHEWIDELAIKGPSADVRTQH